MPCSGPSSIRVTGPSLSGGNGTMRTCLWILAPTILRLPILILTQIPVTPTLVFLISCEGCDRDFNFVFQLLSVFVEEVKICDNI